MTFIVLQSSVGITQDLTWVISYNLTGNNCKVQQKHLGLVSVKLLNIQSARVCCTLVLPCLKYTDLHVTLNT